MAILISPDVPLVLFSFLSAFSFFHCSESCQASFTGGAVQFCRVSGFGEQSLALQNILSIFLLPAFGLWFLFRRNGAGFWKRPWWGLGAFTLGASPFLFQHLYWNATHCWANLLFNFVIRQDVYDGPAIQTFGLYLVYLVLLATPFLLKDAFKKANSENIEQHDLNLFVLLCWSVPIFLFGLTALKSRGQGLHWYFSYVPFFSCGSD